MIKLLKGNCLDLLRQLEPGCADLVLIDPPYSSGGLFAGDRKQDTRVKYTDADFLKVGEHCKPERVILVKWTNESRTEGACSFPFIETTNRRRRDHAKSKELESGRSPCIVSAGP